MEPSGVIWAQDNGGSLLSGIEIVGMPKCWIGERRGPYGPVFFGAVIHNATRERLLVGVNFRAYKADGSYFETCDFGETDVDIAPGEKALVYCQPSSVPRTTQGIRVVVRLVSAKRLRSFSLDALIEKLELTADPPQNGSEEWTFTAMVRPRTTPYREVIVPDGPKRTVMYEWLDEKGVPSFSEKPPVGKDVEKNLMFRIYDKDDVQIGTCFAGEYLFQAEVSQRISCSKNFDLSIPKPNKTVLDVPSGGPF